MMMRWWPSVWTIRRSSNNRSSSCDTVCLMVVCSTKIPTLKHYPSLPNLAPSPQKAHEGKVSLHFKIVSEFLAILDHLIWKIPQTNTTAIRPNKITIQLAAARMKDPLLLDRLRIKLKVIIMLAKPTATSSITHSAVLATKIKLLLLVAAKMVQIVRGSLIRR